MVSRTIQAIHEEPDACARLEIGLFPELPKCVSGSLMKTGEKVKKIAKCGEKLV